MSRDFQDTVAEYIGPSPDTFFSTQVAMPYGGMPHEALISKMEYTADNYDIENMYEDHARDLLKDRRPDTATFEHETARQSTSNKGYLNVLHSGGRGTENWPAMPEINTEFTDRDPRKTSSDPDFYPLRLQLESRMRFVNFGSGNDDQSITAGHWRENQIRDAKKQLMVLMKPRLRIFSTSYDNKRNGLRRTWAHKSSAAQQASTRTYGDAITDAGLNPQRRTTIISNKDNRYSPWYHQDTTDHEFAVASYSQDGRRRKLNTTENKVLMYEGQAGANSEDVQCDNVTMDRRAAQAIVQAKIIEQVANDTDISDPTTALSKLRRESRNFTNLEDILVALRNQRLDADFATEGTGQERKQAHIEAKMLAARNAEEDAERAAEQAVKQFKTVNTASDRAANANAQSEDYDRTDASGDSQQRKQGSSIAKNISKHTIAKVKGDSQTIASYKSLRHQAPPTQRNADYDADLNKSAKTQIRKVDHKQYNTNNQNERVFGMEFNHQDGNFSTGMTKQFANMKIASYADNSRDFLVSAETA